MKTKQRYPTPFEEKVYAALRRIPRGKVLTYAGMARMVGCKSCQAVGQALKRNPFAPVVPCHRVIASDPSLGGFQGKRVGPALQRKMKLLASEGVLFKDGLLAEPERVWDGRT